MDKNTFAQSAKSAMHDGNVARLSLAQSHAHNFIHGNAAFNPVALQKLGTAGMIQFLQAVSAHGVAFNPPPATDFSTKLKTPLASTAIASGWADERCAEPQWAIRAIAWGISSGLVPIVMGVACFKVFNI